MKQQEHVSVDEGYARWAAAYDGYRNPLIASEEPALRALCLEACGGDVRGKTLLDTACGTGRHTAFFAASGAHVTGLDQSAEMLAQAQKKTKATLVRGSVLDLPAPFASRFDIVVNALMAEHVEDIDALFRALASVTAEGGAVCFSAYHPAMIEKGVRTHFDDGGTEVVLPTFKHSVERMVAAVAKAGLALDAQQERIVDDALITAMPHMEKHRAMPLAILLRATR